MTMLAFTLPRRAVLSCILFATAPFLSAAACLSVEAVVMAPYARKGRAASPTTASAQRAVTPHDEIPGQADSHSPRRWLRRRVSFNVRQYPLAAFLQEFSAAQGLSCRISPLLQGTVTGAFSFHNPGELLEMICRAQNMNWYYDGGAVHYFASSETASRLFPMKGKHESALRRTLTELGWYDDRFSWRTADSGRLILAQGPEVYLDKIASVLDRQNEIDAVPEKKLVVFKLKHAWAAERVVTSGNVNTRVPGVADLLRQILSGTPARAAPATEAAGAPGVPRRMKNARPAGRDDAPDPKAAQAESGVPFIQADTRLNAVLVWDYDDNLRRHRAIVEMLDQPLALVEIRAAIMDVETTRTRDLGISWEYRNKGGSWSNDAGSNLGSGDGRVDFDSIGGNGFQYATIYTRGLDQFMMRVSAMEKDGFADILSRPSVLTQDNMQATLEHTETFYVKLEGEREVDLADITTGLTLRVTPHVIDDGAGGVQLAVYIANGTDSYTEETAVDNLPRVRQSVISTQAVVHEGEALVIGGYYNELRRTTNTGVPVLKDIPGLGALFRTRERSNSKSERLFVLSPRIIYPGQSPVVDGSEGERMLRDSPAREVMKKPARPTPALPDADQPVKRRRGIRSPRKAQ